MEPKKHSINMVKFSGCQNRIICLKNCSSFEILCFLQTSIQAVQGRSYKLWTGGGQVQTGIFFDRKYEPGVKESNVSSSC